MINKDRGSYVIYVFFFYSCNEFGMGLFMWNVKNKICIGKRIFKLI